MLNYVESWAKLLRNVGSLCIMNIIIVTPNFKIA